VKLCAGRCKWVFQRLRCEMEPRSNSPRKYKFAFVRVHSRLSENGVSWKLEPRPGSSGRQKIVLARLRMPLSPDGKRRKS
jgi:hypothetical protein